MSLLYKSKEKKDNFFRKLKLTNLETISSYNSIIPCRYSVTPMSEIILHMKINIKYFIPIRFNNACRAFFNS